jgi:hypothetical protein
MRYPAERKGLPPVRWSWNAATSACWFATATDAVILSAVRGELIAQAYAALNAGDVTPLVALLDPNVRWIGVGGVWNETPTWENRGEVVDLLQQHIANGRRFAVTNYIESGDQVAATLTVTGPPIPEPVSLTKIFTFRSGTNVVVQMNDGVDVLALHAQYAEYFDNEEDE